MKKHILLFSLLASFLLLQGCEKITNTTKNIQSDLIGLDRKIQIYSCYSGKLIKEYQGSVRLNQDDHFAEGASILVNGKKLHTNMCFVIQELGIKEEAVN